MAPHVVPVETQHEQRLADLKEFKITCNAFLPAESPSKRLSDTYYKPWELVACHLAELIDDGSIRDAVAQLPMLGTDRLNSEADWRRAFVILAYITHAYVWGGEEAEEVSQQYATAYLTMLTVVLQVLPPQITVPFLRVSSHLELPPVLTYAGANLWNFTCPHNDFGIVEDLKLLCSFTGTESESWFLLISVAMEARGASIIDTMIGAANAIKTRDYDTITDALDALRDCIRDVSKLLERMYERCDPMTFYHRIRPYLAGSKNMAAAGLPRGVFYDEGHGKGQWRQLAGGNNGQSSLIQFFDIVLGVDHKGNGNSAPSPGEKSFHAEVREYMPGPHRQFLQYAAHMGSIRELALLPPNTEEQRRLREAYVGATDALRDFRNEHIKIVTRYIVLPSRQPWKGTRKNLASSSSGGKASQELTGTGGSCLMPFLKQARDETAYAGRLDK